MKRISLWAIVLLCVVSVGLASAADVEPTDIQQPGTQPGELGNLESPDKCDNCHGGYNTSVEPAFNWRGSMMANAGRDPIFWATVAIAEQGFDGSGDLCIRCHSTGGWYGGRSTPTDGSGLAASDADGVDCDACHKMTNPDQTELAGVMNDPFVAKYVTPGYDGATGYYGSGMLSLWGGSDKLGPYDDAEARHKFLQSSFHRSEDYCGSCHDVSNPAVGDLAHNNGAQIPLAELNPPGVFSGLPGSPVNGKAAFNNFPYQYGVVERTFSEFKSGALSQTLVSAYGGLPDDLKVGAIAAAASAAGGNYADGTDRYFSCQTCHMRAVTGVGCDKKGAPLRSDLPLHDMTGGNYWIADAILYQDGEGMLRLGGGLTGTQVDALQAGQDRARQQLDLAASLTVDGDTLKVTNLTGHKLISGYPEGRRMWLNIKWYDGVGTLLREDGKYGNLVVDIDGKSTTVKTIVNLTDLNTKIYEAHYAMTQKWAQQLLDLGYLRSLPLSYNRETGAVDYTLGQLADQDPGTYHETFHFVLNNHVAKDNRIPPFGFRYDDAEARNALPVPDDQYGNPGAGGEYRYWDEFALNPPAAPVAATYATIDLLYQPTSWEYIQFLYLANDGSVPFLADEGVNMLQAWLNTGMAEPHVMASAEWGTSAPPPICTIVAPTGLTATPGHTQVALTWLPVIDADGYKLYYDQAGKAQLVVDVGANTSYADIGLTNGVSYCYRASAYSTEPECESEYSAIVCATPENQGQTTPPAGVTALETGLYTGKGKNRTFDGRTEFSQGDSVTIRARVADGDTSSYLANATVEITIDGPETVKLNSNPSGADGWAEATWQSQKPNKKGQGGTATGSYTATVTNVTATGYHWDNVKTSVSFTIN